MNKGIRTQYRKKPSVVLGCLTRQNSEEEKELHGPRGREQIPLHHFLLLKIQASTE